MKVITANELKTKGITALNKHNEAIITIRGEERYVIMSMALYNRLHELELIAAIEEAKKDIAAGRVFDGSIKDHIERITKK